MVQVCKYRPATPKMAARRRAAIDRHLEAALFRALGDETRLRMFSCLARCGRPCTVSEIAECCSVDFSVVSRHLRVLSDAGVLTGRRRGREVSYAVRYAKLTAQLRAIAQAINDCADERQGGCCG